MRIGRVLIAIGVLLVPTAAAADGHRAGFSFGYARTAGSALNGVYFAGDYSPKAQTLFSVMGDISITSGSHLGSDVTRITWSAGGNVGHKLLSRLAVSGHGLVGGVSGDGRKDAAFFLGGAFDVLLNKVGSVGIRVQGDQAFRGDGAEDFPRLFVGLVWKQLKTR